MSSSFLYFLIFTAQNLLTLMCIYIWCSTSLWGIRTDREPILMSEKYKKKEVYTHHEKSIHRNRSLCRNCLCYYDGDHPWFPNCESFLILFYKKTNYYEKIFITVYCMYHPDFYWDMVQLPLNVSWTMGGKNRRS